MINIKKLTLTCYTAIFLLFFATCQDSFCAPRQSIYILFDKVISSSNFFQIAINLQELSSNKFNIKSISANEVGNGEWRKDAFMFVIPGSRIIRYQEILGTKGNTEIVNFIKNGGKYLGICSGAYYGTQYEFYTGGRLTNFGKGLDLLPIKTIGPLYEYSSENTSGSKSIKINFNPDFYSGSSNVFYNGGGYFDMSSYQGKDIKVIGYYEQGLPAIIGFKYGKGKVVLSSIHIEVDPFLMTKSDCYLAKIIDSLIKENDNRIKISSIVFKYLAS